jgi:hypothetical protein
MNDYAHSAVETLAWVLALIEDSDDVGREAKPISSEKGGRGWESVKRSHVDESVRSAHDRLSIVRCSAQRRLPIL